MKKILVVILVTGAALFCIYLYQWGSESGSRNGAPARAVPTRKSTLPRGNSAQQLEEAESLKYVEASNQLRIAYQTLARSTSLPDASVDVSGMNLPKEFIDYLADKNLGIESIVNRLNAESFAAFESFWRSVDAVGVAHFIEFVATNHASEKPSTLDFLLYSAVGELIAEYPPMNELSISFYAQQWNLLIHSSNPVFRFLAIERIHRAIRDKAGALSLLETRASEVDPLIVGTLINQIASIGGDAGIPILTRISEEAAARGDQVVSGLARDAIDKLAINQ